MSYKIGEKVCNDGDTMVFTEIDTKKHSKRQVKVKVGTKEFFDLMEELEKRGIVEKGPDERKQKEEKQKGKNSLERDIMYNALKLKSHLDKINFNELIVVLKELDRVSVPAEYAMVKMILAVYFDSHYEGNIRGYKGPLYSITNLNGEVVKVTDNARKFLCYKTIPLFRSAEDAIMAQRVLYKATPIFADKKK